jgi:hypothetical protein
LFFWGFPYEGEVVMDDDSRKLRPVATTEFPSIGSLDNQTRQKKSTSVGWTLKGIPDETIQMTRSAARRRGMRIGSWVADALFKAASQDLDNAPARQEPNAEVIRRFEEFSEAVGKEIQAVVEQNRILEQELAIIRRGLLPRIGGRNSDEGD